MLFHFNWAAIFVFCFHVIFTLSTLISIHRKRHAAGELKSQQISEMS